MKQKGIRKNIKAETHPSHYMMHKYWGRKPHNVVRDYLLTYTKPGDTVLDPFMGSGVVVIEALKNNRKAIGVDLNPIACIIASNTIETWSEENFVREFNSIYDRVWKKFSDLYLVKCPKCSKPTYFENSIWDGDKFLKIRGTCDKCGKFIKNVSQSDKATFNQAAALFKKLDKRGQLQYPKDEILKYVKRNGKSHLNEFFSERALIILGTLIKEIRQVKNRKTRDLLLMSFTSMLPNVSKMIPGDEKSVNGKSGWVISKLWAPKIHTEKNVFNSFKWRFKKIRKGKKELDGKVNPDDAKILNITSENLSSIKSNSIDYIFTDPPYGDSIAYFGLSMFWNAWLGKKVDYEGEIIYDPYRNKKYQDYTARMCNVFDQLFRVLKDKAHLSFTFNNRDLRIWKAVMHAVRNAGFHLENVVYQEQAVASGTQGINWKNTLKGDFVYNLVKDEGRFKPLDKPSKDTQDLIVKNVSRWIKQSENGITSNNLYERLIPIVVENNSYANEDGSIVNIDDILWSKFKYGPIEKKAPIEYVWQEK
jgi:16S rRNA G966 N2-methylase RsmD